MELWGAAGAGAAVPFVHYFFLTCRHYFFFAAWISSTVGCCVFWRMPRFRRLRDKPRGLAW